MSDDLLENSTNTSGILGNLNISGLALNALYIAGTIASILGVFYLIHVIFHIKINENSFMSYFDADKGDYVQDRQYFVKWGYSFKRPVYLPHKFNSGSVLDMWFKPMTGPMDILTEEHYEPKTNRSLTKILLSDKKFFKEKEVEKIRTKITSRLNHEELIELTNNITVSVLNDRIVIKNNNEELIKNYPVNMPPNIPANKGFEYINTITHVETYRIIPNADPRSTEQSLVLLVNIPKNSDGGVTELPILT